VIQIFGTKKCADTRKAERFFSDRRVQVQSIDLNQKGMSPGELRSVAARAGGMLALLDRDGKRFAARGLKHAMLGDPDIERLLIGDPLLLRTPIVRNGKEATVGIASEVWTRWLDTP
jgi:arsenate reductase